MDVPYQAAPLAGLTRNFEYHSIENHSSNLYHCVAIVRGCEKTSPNLRIGRSKLHPYK